MSIDLGGALSQIGTLYHFTDTRNIESIKHLGGLFSMAELREMGLDFNVHPGGNDWSLTADQQSGMDKYVHLCFKDRHPMEYKARTEGRIQDSVFLCINRDILKKPGVLFSPGISNKSGMTYYSIDQCHSHIDFEVLYTFMDWSDQTVKERLRAAEKYEVLVPDHIPLSMIRNL